MDVEESKWLDRYPGKPLHTFSTDSVELTGKQGAVPSQAHVDLEKAGVITHPLLGINGKFAWRNPNPLFKTFN
jgi:hypothetical protein